MLLLSLRPILFVTLTAACFVVACAEQQRPQIAPNALDDLQSNGKWKRHRGMQQGGEYHFLSLGSIVGEEPSLNITVTNLAYAQPLSPFFVLVHDSTAEPVFRVGMPASNELARLAEFGDPSELIAKYNSTDRSAAGVLAAFQGSAAPLFPGQSVSFLLPVNPFYPLFSFACMAGNTNDMFVGLDSEVIFGKIILAAPGYDAGSEENNESCTAVPGPACVNSTNERSLNGEGFVHIHRGIHGTGDLDAATYDWRNPVALLHVSTA